MEPQGLVGLNVGGTHFLTSRTTLTRYRDSMLGVLVEGSIPTQQDEGGRYCIDRDGSLFQHVLNFLRTGTLALPDDFNQYEQLTLEADFYQIQPLIEALHERRSKKKLAPAVQHLDGKSLEVIECRGMQFGRTEGLEQLTYTNETLKFTQIEGAEDVLRELRFNCNVILRRFQKGREELHLYGDTHPRQVRRRLADNLLSQGWILQGTSSSSTSLNDEVLLFYRDRWLLPK